MILSKNTDNGLFCMTLQETYLSFDKFPVIVIVELVSEGDKFTTLTLDSLNNITWTVSVALWAVSVNV